MELAYSIFDPTGNITALVESPVAAVRQQEAAAAIMRLHPEVEQVGFLCLAGKDGLPGLRMAGGEFCGNASMCAAALFSLRTGGAEKLRLYVSGSARPVEITLHRIGENTFRAGLRMPPAVEITERAFAFEDLRGAMPLVRMQGISHLVAEKSTVFYSLLKDPQRAECAVKAFCLELGADGLGLLFLDGEGGDYRLTPLVYIPGSGTVFWENSCASGSAAVGMYLAERRASPVTVSLREPGGVLRVASDGRTGATDLYGSVRLTARHVFTL